MTDTEMTAIMLCPDHVFHRPRRSKSNFQEKHHRRFLQQMEVLKLTGAVHHPELKQKYTSGVGKPVRRVEGSRPRPLERSRRVQLFPLAAQSWVILLMLWSAFAKNSRVVVMNLLYGAFLSAAALSAAALVPAAFSASVLLILLIENRAWQAFKSLIAHQTFFCRISR